MAEFVVWLLGKLTAEQWDGWRNWVATLGGLIALFVAVRTYRRNGKIKREEQARLVYAKITYVGEHNLGDGITFLKNGAAAGIRAAAVQAHSHGGGVTYTAKEPIIQAVIAVHNGSKELIGPAKVQLVNRGAGTKYEVSGIIGTVDPEGDTLIELTVTNDVAPSWPPLGATVIFRDASGAWWRRHLAEPVEAVHDDPENWIRGRKERDETRASQVTQGIAPLAEPKVTIRTEWHRFRRRLQGKPPIP